MNWKTCSVLAGSGIGKHCADASKRALCSSPDPLLRLKNGYARDDAAFY